MQKEKCNKCGAILMSYYLKNGTCRGCLNPELIVEAKVNKVYHIVNSNNDIVRSFDTKLMAEIALKALKNLKKNDYRIVIKVKE